MSAEGVESFEGWVIAEMMGHRKLAGYMKQANVAGSPMMRLDMYVGDSKEPTVTQFYSSAAFYCITPTTEEMCRAFAQRCVPAPVARFELPALPARPSPPGPGEDGWCDECKSSVCRCEPDDEDDPECG